MVDQEKKNAIEAALTQKRDPRAGLKGKENEAELTLEELWKELHAFTQQIKNSNEFPELDINHELEFKPGKAPGEKIKTEESVIDRLEYIIANKENIVGKQAITEAQKALEEFSQGAERMEKTAKSADKSRWNSLGNAFKSFGKAAGSLIVGKTKEAKSHIKDAKAFFKSLGKKNRKGIQNTRAARMVQGERAKKAKSWVEKIKNRKAEAKEQSTSREA